MNQMAKDISAKQDPVRIEILRHALVAAAEEMGVTVARTGRSNVVREMLDFSTAIFDIHGNNVGQAARIPFHLNTMTPCLQEVLTRHIAPEKWEEHDVVLVNDPYCGGQHLPDITVFQPIFFEGEHIGYAGTMAHFADIGGGSAGSYNASAVDIFAEGIRIPPVKLYKRGALNEDVMTLLMSNVRGKEIFRGDLGAVVASVGIGTRNVVRLAAKYGTAFLKHGFQAILDQSEAAMRNAIAAVPDGVYEFEESVDSDGINEEPFRIKVALTVRNDEVVVDFDGTAAQVAGPVNCTINMTKAAVFYALVSSLTDNLAATSGCYAPVEVVAPAGSVVNCSFPAPVVNRVIVGHRIVTAIMGALAKALPERIPAAYYSITHCVAMETVDDGGNRAIFFDCEVGGWGGTPFDDGASAFSAGLHNIAACPLEIIESTIPITFTRFGLRPDSGGKGKHRGGLGLIKEWRLEAASAVLSASADRFRTGAYGLAGGEAGQTGKMTLTAADGTERALTSKFAGLRIRKGDTIRIETPGGGGFGRPQERSEEALARDIELAYVTA